MQHVLRFRTNAFHWHIPPNVLESEYTEMRCMDECVRKAVRLRLAKNTRTDGCRWNSSPTGSGLGLSADSMQPHRNWIEWKWEGWLVTARVRHAFHLIIWQLSHGLNYNYVPQCDVPTIYISGWHACEFFVMPRLCTLCSICIHGWHSGSGSNASTAGRRRLQWFRSRQSTQNFFNNGQFGATFRVGCVSL